MKKKLIAFKIQSAVEINNWKSLVLNNLITEGHFTMLVYDQNTKVGCAAVQWTEEDGEAKITCNYNKSPLAENQFTAKVRLAVNVKIVMKMIRLECAIVDFIVK